MIRRRDFLMTTAAGCWSALGATRRRDGGLVIDAHAHFYPEAWIKLIELEGAGSGAKMTRSGDGWLFEKEGWRAASIAHSAVDLGERLRLMDQQGVDMQALSLTTPMVHWAKPELGLKLARAYNDAAAAASREHPSRFVGMTVLPLQAPELALGELERASKLSGMRGLYMPTTVVGKELDDPAFLPLYARCEQMGWPIFLHPVETLGVDRTAAKYYLNNLLGNPYDTGVAASRLIFGGVLDMFPKLEIMLPHAGGAFPSLVGRLDRGVHERAELKHMKKPASSYLRRFTYDTIAHDDQLLMNLIREVGADRVVMGSDYPFDMGYPQPVAVVERLKLPAKDRDQILGGTAAKLLRIGG